MVSFMIQQNRLYLRELYKQAQGITDRRQDQKQVSPRHSSPPAQAPWGGGSDGGLGQGSASAPPSHLASWKRGVEVS